MDQIKCNSFTAPQLPCEIPSSEEEEEEKEEREEGK